MSKPNAWTLTGLDAFVCAMWMEAFYHDHWNTVYDNIVEYRNGDSFMSREEFFLDRGVGTEDSRRSFMLFLGILESLEKK